MMPDDATEQTADAIPDDETPVEPAMGDGAPTGDQAWPRTTFPEADLPLATWPPKTGLGVP